MKKVIVLILMAGMAGMFGIAQGQTTTTTLTPVERTLVMELLAQLQVLQARLNAFLQMQGGQGGPIYASLTFTRNVSQGARGTDVQLLQEVLATDPAIYPQGLITGFYGPLTAQAVMRFQAAANIAQVGVVGPITRAKLNQILLEGIGTAGSIPSGFLTMPHIRAKLTGQVCAQVLTTARNPATNEVRTFATPCDVPVGWVVIGTGGATDTTAPIITNVSANPSTTSTTSMLIRWITNEPADSAVYYGTSTPLNIASALRVTNASFVTNHDSALNNLATSTTYYYVVTSKDISGNNATSAQQSFVR